MNRSSAISRETSSETTHHFPTEKGTFDRAGHLQWRMVRSIAIKWSLHPAFGRFNKSSWSGARPCYGLLARLSFFAEKTKGKKENRVEGGEFQLCVSAYTETSFECTFTYFLSFAYCAESNNQSFASFALAWLTICRNFNVKSQKSCKIFLYTRKI